MNVNQKGTALVDGALTDEVLDSSHSVLAAGMFGQGQKGLQQFYTPPEAAKLIAKVIGSRVSVLDPTAGDGMLLSEFPLTMRYGVEIDADQIKNAKEATRGYNAIHGDIQNVYHLIRQGMQSWPAIVANPPFGLQWQDDTVRDGRPTNSTVMTFLYAMRLLSEDGQLAFICGRDRFHRQIVTLSEAAGIYAAVECDELFNGVSLPCIIAFAVHPGTRAASTHGFETRQVTRDMLDLLAEWVTDLRTAALGEYGSIGTYDHSMYERAKQFESIQTEYRRRQEGKAKANREFDALLVGGKSIQWLPSAFARMALTKANDYYAFEGLNGQPITYFAQNERLWNKLLAYEDQKLITIEPKLFHAVEQQIGVLRKERVPLYKVKPTQRLGFLTDVDFLRCIKDDAEKGFSKGESYRLDTKSKTLVTREKRLVESKKNPGEYVEKEFETHQKTLEIRVGHYSIVDGGQKASQEIKWLLNHFDIPDPGEVASKHPKDIAALETLVREVMTEMQHNSRVWEEANPGKWTMPFKIRDFQVKDIARMLFKQGGLLSWEQGLGKTAGFCAFYLAALRLGAQDATLVVTANDLIDQWQRECQRFLGKQATIIKTHGQAKNIAHDLRRGGTGFYITHYGVLSINGTKGKNLLLPPVTVKEWTEPRKVKGTDKWGYSYFAHVDDEETPIAKDVVEAAAREKWDENPPHEHEPSQRELLRLAAKQLGYIQIPIEDAHAFDAKHPGMRLSGHIPYREYKIIKRLTSKDLCPECEADWKNGWNGAYCEAEKPDGSKCGYSHYAIKVKPIASLLSTAFRRGIGCYDEIQMIQAKAGVTGSKRSKALRGPRFKWFLGMTGTPIKNYIEQAHWPLWKSLGNASVRYPYDYDSGDMKFQSDFAVIEYQRSGGRRTDRKALPEVTNLSLLWRLLASSCIRRRKEETGEKLVPKFYHEIRVPLGLAQAEQIQSWLLNFPDLFKEKYPEHPMVKAGFHKIRAATLGLNWKLDYACHLPEADPDAAWTGVEGVSNWTPANLRTLELALALVKNGRKVLIGSHLKEYGKWTAERLVERGVNAVHILDENSNTVDADERADRVFEFQTDENTMVFCAGTKAVRLGHNLDAADAVILNGLDFDYEGLDQFIARIHRLTSKNPIDVFVILPTLDGQHTITTRKWQLLDMKGSAAELALDGRLILKNEKQVSLDEMVHELMQRGLTVTNEAVDEVSVFEEWERMPFLENYDPPESIIPQRAYVEEPTPATCVTEEEHLACGVIAAFFATLATDTAVDTQLDLLSAPAYVPDELAIESNASEMDKQLEDELTSLELQALVAIDTKSSDLSSDEPETSDAPLPASEDGGDEPSEAVEPGADVVNPSLAPAIYTHDENTRSESADSVDGDIAREDGSEPPSKTHSESHVETREGEAKPDSPPEPVGPPMTPPALSPLDELRKAKDLHDLGILNDEEWTFLKASLIAKATA